MTMSKSTQAIVPNCHVIKIGGSTLANLSEAFIKSLKRRVAAGQNIIVVHGGGPNINEALAHQGIVSETIDGIRVTTPEMIATIRNILIGEVNSGLVGKINASGISAAGLSGFDGVFTSDYLEQEIYGEVGVVTDVNALKFKLFLKGGIIPVVACIGTSATGGPLNINADTLAAGIASGVQAESLLLVTDTPGIKKDGVTVTAASEQDIRKWVANGIIYGGMIPKVQAALDCLEAGVKAVQITDDTLVGTTVQATNPLITRLTKEVHTNA